MITVREAKSQQELLEFIEFPNRLYAGVPQYVPSLVMDELSNLSPKKNPAFEYCDMRFFLAEKEGEVVGRIGGIISHKANDLWQEKKLRITRMDFIEDYAVFEALIHTLEDWAKSCSLTELAGPIGFL